jgi:hypothetical protein
MDRLAPEPFWTYREQKNVLHVTEIEPRLPYGTGRNLVTTLTELHRLKFQFF